LRRAPFRRGDRYGWVRMPYVLYRIVRTKAPRRLDFWSDLANGLPSRPPQRADVMEWAALRAHLYRLGQFLVVLTIPDDNKARILVKQTFGPGHYSACGDPAEFLAYVRQTLPVPPRTGVQ
jgi:hypothetical protein